MAPPTGEGWTPVRPAGEYLEKEQEDGGFYREPSTAETDAVRLQNAYSRSPDDGQSGTRSPLAQLVRALH